MKSNELESLIISLEMEINIIEHDLDILSLDIKSMSIILNKLEYNHSFLKKEAKVVSIAEYKKTYKEIKQIKNKLKNANRFVFTLSQEMEQKTSVLIDYYKKVEEEVNSLKRKVLKFEKKDRK